MRPLVALLAICLLSASVTACGDRGKRTTSKSSDATATDTSASIIASNDPSPVRDLGDDNDGDNDNELVRGFGHEANEADKHAVTTLIKHYYAAAFAHDGAVACSLIYSPLAKAIAQEFGQHLPALRGKTCAVVLSKLFKQEHRRLAIDIATKVSTVRIRGDDGWAMLYYTNTRPERYIPVLRENGVWKMDALLENRLP
jgi:hypothetical protein